MWRTPPHRPPGMVFGENVLRGSEISSKETGADRTFWGIDIGIGHMEFDLFVLFLSIWRFIEAVGE